MKPEKIASQMALNPDIVFLDHAAFSPMPKRTAMIMASFTKAKAEFGTLAPEFDFLEFWEEKMPQALQITADIIGGDPEGVGFTRSTLQGLHTVVEGFPWKSGNSLLINDLEFTTNSFVHQIIAKKNGLDLRVVKNHNGILQLEDFETLIDKHTKIVALSLVQFSNGFRAPIKEIAKLVHEVDGYLLIDGIQAVGAMPVDCKELGIDALAAGGYKWALGPFLTGYVWTTKELHELLVPSFVGWWSSENPLEMSHCDFIPAKTGRHYEPSPAWEILGMIESFKFLLEIGLQNIFSNILTVNDYLVERCEEANIEVYSSMVPDHRSGIINLGWSKMDAVKIVNKLKQQSIAVSPRAGRIRVSPHGYNTKEDIDRFIDVLITLK